MLERILSSRTFITAEGALDGLAARQSAIADNIANADTPGYKRKSVSFESALASAVNQAVSPATGAPTGTRGPFRPQIVQDQATSMRLDGNSVDLEREMVQLADNTLRYQALTDYMQSYFQGIKAVINSR